MPIVSISQASQSGAIRLASELHRRLGPPVGRPKDASTAAARFGVSGEDLHRGLDMPSTMSERLTRERERSVLGMPSALGRRLDEARVAGVVPMTDTFDIVAEFVRGQGAARS